MKKSSIIRKFSTILVFAVLAVLFLTTACTKKPLEEKPLEEEDKVGIITMTSLASEVSIWITIPLETDANVHINWGDGTECNMNDASINIESSDNDQLYLFFLHNYSSESAHYITITSKKILHLNCHSNKLTFLDISQNNALVSLTCYRNQLTSLDLRHNNVLKELHCSENPLTTLDLSNNKALSKLVIGSNELSSLDLSNNTALTYLGVYGSQLTFLDVSKNSELVRLYCTDTKLINLDVSNNKKLRFLLLTDNQLTSTALNALFKTLPNISSSEPEGRMRITGNPGARGCDYSISASKRWIQWNFLRPWNEISSSSIENAELYLNYRKQ